MALPTSCLLILATFVSLAAAYSGKVLVVSFDGFRWDYLNNINGLVNFERMAKEGVKVPYMNATFSTVTFPNHYSIATGLYQESHGIVQNTIYDPEFNDWFDRSNMETRWWDAGEPIWITAVKQGMKSGAYHWSGSPVEIQNQTATFFTEYDITTPWEDRVDTTLGWFINDGIDVGLIYFHEPDNYGHYYGPGSDEVADMVREVDGHLGYIMAELSNRGLDDVNLIVVSDHGMAEVEYDKVIDLLDYINETDTDVINNNECVCMILPKPGKMDDIIQALDGVHDHMHVYRKEDMPEKWHYRDNRRILPIQVIMDEGWQCTVNKSDDDWLKIEKGNHGWDNDNMNMKSIFLARGPDFKSDYAAPSSINNVDVYPLLCELLALAPAPNNGSLAHTHHMLVDSTHGAGTSHQAAWGLVGLAAWGALLLHLF